MQKRETNQEGATSEDDTNQGDLNGDIPDAEGETGTGIEAPLPEGPPSDESKITQSNPLQNSGLNSNVTPGTHQAFKEEPRKEGKEDEKEGPKDLKGNSTKNLKITVPISSDSIMSGETTNPNLILSSKVFYSIAGICFVLMIVNFVAMYYFRNRGNYWLMIGIVAQLILYIVSIVATKYIGEYFNGVQSAPGNTPSGKE